VSDFVRPLERLDVVGQVVSGISEKDSAFILEGKMGQRMTGSNLIPSTHE
jgi:hypothetical protein